MATAQDYYRSGDLHAALTASAEELKRSPADVGKRAFFVELLCIRGDFERADRQLDTLVTLDPATLVTVGVWRQLIRAALTRMDVFQQGHVPEVVAEPSPRIQGLLELLLAVREQRYDDAAAAALALEDARTPHPARVNGIEVDDLRDLDDLSAGVLEVLGSNGKYFWIDFEQISALEFAPPQRPLDLLWRRASLTLTSGSEGEVFLPAIYPTATEDASALLGRKTEWLEREGLVQGVGQRIWLAGNETLALTEIKTFEAVEAQLDRTAE